MILRKFTKGGSDDFSPYEDIKLSEAEYRLVASSVPAQIFKKLHKITEYRLAMKLSRGQITKEEFDGAMRYGTHLIQYFGNK